MKNGKKDLSDCDAKYEVYDQRARSIVEIPTVKLFLKGNASRNACPTTLIIPTPFEWLILVMYITTNS